MIWRAAVVIAVLIVGSATAHAQNPPQQEPESSSYVGGGILIAADDADERVTLPAGASRHLWFLEAAYMPARTAVGVEWARSAEAAGIPQPLRPSDEQNESVLLGTVKFRASQTERVSVDLVGAAGVHWQRRQTVTLACSPRCIRLEDDERTIKPAFAFGADFPVGLTPHVALSGIARVYVLPRLRVSSDTVHTEAVFRLAVGIAARYGW